MSILASFVVPHPPLIIPEIGRGGEKQIEETTRAYESVADMISGLQPETIVIISPHATMYSDYFHISPVVEARGSFAGFHAGVRQQPCLVRRRDGRPCLLPPECAVRGS